MSANQSPSFKPHQIALLGAGLVSAGAWAVPLLRTLFLPLLYLNTHLHELCHALAAHLTGGSAMAIYVYANGSGLTPVLGGVLLVVASAGYVGASVVGAGMILGGRTPGGAKTVLRALAVALALSTVLFVRGDTVGLFAGILWVGGLWLMSTYLKDRALLFAAQFLGLQQCLNSLQSLYDLLRISAGGSGHSDAGLMASRSGIPAIVWAVAWCALSLMAIGLAVRRTWATERRSGGG